MPSEERLHPVSILFSFGRSLKAFALPGLVGLVIAARQPGPNADAWMMLFLIPAAIVAVVRYLTFRLRYKGEELVIQSGLIFRNERHIPYARIQNLDAVQNVVHRLLRVIEVRVQTGAGAEPEATISVLPATALDEMRRRVFAREAPPTEARRVDERVLLQMPLGELLLHGFLVNRGMVVIGAIYGLLWQLGITERLLEPMTGNDSDERGIVRELVEAAVRGGGVSASQIAVAAGAVLLFLIVVRFASMCWAAVRLYGFRLTVVGEDLRIDNGLFTKFTATVPIRRIQAVTITEGPLYRFVDRVSVRVETAGGRTGRESAANMREWLAPLLRRDRLDPLMAEVMRDENPRLAWMPVHPRAFRRLVKRRVTGGSCGDDSGGARDRVARTDRRRRSGSVERVRCAALRRPPRLDGIRQRRRVQERLVVAQHNVRAHVTDPGRDPAGVAVRPACRDGARPRGYGRRERAVAPDRHSLPPAGHGRRSCSVGWRLQAADTQFHW